MTSLAGMGDLDTIYFINSDASEPRLLAEVGALGKDRLFLQHSIVEK